MLRLACGKTTIVDGEDYEKCAAYAWHSNGTYAHSDIVGYLHRFLMEPDQGKVVDHINGDGFDNRRANLRICSRKENMRNQKRRSDNRSGYKGVFWEIACAKWRALIRIDGKNKHLGVFDSKEEAAHAYNTAALKLFGEFARINEVPDDK